MSLTDARTQLPDLDTLSDHPSKLLEAVKKLTAAAHLTLGAVENIAPAPVPPVAEVPKAEPAIEASAVGLEP
jgi:hypothetical protein